MDFFDALNTSSAALSAQRLRMNLISGNLANVNTTRTNQGGPYRRKEAVFAAQPLNQSFKRILADRQNNTISTVKVARVVEDRNPPVLKYDPQHPDADAKGYVAMPNINLMEEMVNMISATRGYEANVTALKAAKDMALKALEIGR
ncbi:Flagellar basal-body rod protein FlgC [Olavius sp. associated proteobacterium Delta 1]|nr:Flagellar basal-body rod protein FlgC [Olavius sp. associated proteobacterium Delta 1]